MKTDFSINVQVNLGVTPEIVALVNAILCHRPTVAPTAEEALDGNGQVDNKPEDTTQAQPQQPTNKRGRKKKEEAAADKPEPTKEPAGDEQQEAAANEADANGEQVAGDEQQEAAANEADANGEQVAEQEEAKAEEAAPQNEGQAKAEAEQKPLTAEDVRAAMHKTRQRIEGEDYKENTNGDLYKKYHKPLTAQFKNIAALLGAEKPSALPPDKIANFIEQCNGLQIMEDGTIGSNCPF